MRAFTVLTVEVCLVFGLQVASLLELGANKIEGTRNRLPHTDR